MTDTTNTPSRELGLSSLVLPELQRVAQQLGITGTARMRKSQLIEAIEAAQSGGRSRQRTTKRTQAEPAEGATASPDGAVADGVTGGGSASTVGSVVDGAADSSESSDSSETGDAAARRTRTRTRTRRAGGAGDGEGADSAADVVTVAQPATESVDTKPFAQPSARSAEPAESGSTVSVADQNGSAEAQSGDDQQVGDADADRDTRDGREQSRQGSGRERRPRGDRQAGDRQSGDRQGGDRQGSGRGQQRDSGDDEDGGGRRRRRRRERFREGGGSSSTGGGGGNTRRGGGRERHDGEPQVSEDDVLIPVAGIVDVLDNYAFVRTSGYLPGPNDVYVSMALVKRHGLRKGDAVTGAVRQPRDGERREKFNPLVRVDTVNGADPEVAKQRPEFGKLTPLYPQDRLRLEIDSETVMTRLIDLVSPIGKGQRGLIVSPAKAGKTLIMQGIANAITTNNPEVHLMVVLVDERPEEVTDMQRAVKGEVIASTFDRPADDHTTVAELSIERAKRLVELGHDVVVLLDSITRLGRAYNIAAPASGRILSGGVDSSALYPPKRFFGAARNVENGGSLTIMATALIETGSKADEVIFEEFKGTGNMELRLRREYADKRIYPAIDIDQSGTRREELLMTREELAIVWKLRRVLAGLEGQQALELLLERLKKTKSNAEFLMTINKTMPGVASGSDD